MFFKLIKTKNYSASKSSQLFKSQSSEDEFCKDVQTNNVAMNKNSQTVTLSQSLLQQQYVHEEVDQSFDQSKNLLKSSQDCTSTKTSEIQNANFDQDQPKLSLDTELNLSQILSKQGASVMDPLQSTQQTRQFDNAGQQNQIPSNQNSSQQFDISLLKLKSEEESEIMFENYKSNQEFQEMQDDQQKYLLLKVL